MYIYIYIYVCIYVVKLTENVPVPYGNTDSCSSCAQVHELLFVVVKGKSNINFS